MSQVQQLGEFYAKTGRSIYEREGAVRPVIAFHGETYCLCMLAPSDIHPTDQFGRVAVALAGVVNPRHIAVVVEGWGKSWHHETAPNLQRGDLSRMSETDPEVRTVVMALIYDVRVPSESYSITSTSVGDPRDHQWDILVNEGPMEGAMADTILGAYAAGKDSPFKELPLEFHLAMLHKMGVIDEVILTEEWADASKN